MERIDFSISNSKLDGRRLSGTAHAYGQQTYRNGRVEQFAPGVFSKALETSDVRAFFNHDPNMVLGRQSAGTLVLTDSPDGLAFAIDLPDTSYANDLVELINRGDVDGMSFGFIPGRSVKSSTDDGTPVRTHTEARELIDISPVSLPAFSGTRVELNSRSFDSENNTQLIRAKARARGY